MATVSIDIPTAAIPRVKDMVERFGPQLVPEKIPEGKDPATWTQAETTAVLKGMLVRFVNDLLKQHESEAAADAARQAAIDKVDTDNLVG